MDDRISLFFKKKILTLSIFLIFQKYFLFHEKLIFWGLVCVCMVFKFETKVLKIRLIIEDEGTVSRVNDRTEP